MGTRVKQVKIYVGKHFRLFKNERGWKTLIFAAIISLLIASVLESGMFRYDMDTWTGFFTLVSACIWIGIFNSIQVICKERAIIKREHRTGLHISSYVISHLIYQAVISLLEAVIMIVISAFFLDYPDFALLGFSYLEYFITYFLVIFAADVLGLAVSSIVKTPAVAMTVMPFILIIQLVFSGALFTLNGPLKNVSNLTISRWGLNATCISANYNELESREKQGLEKTFYEVSQENGLALTEEDISAIVDEYYEEGYSSRYAYSMGNLTAQWGILLLHCLVYTLISIAALELIDRDKR